MVGIAKRGNPQIHLFSDKREPPTHLLPHERISVKQWGGAIIIYCRIGNFDSTQSLGNSGCCCVLLEPPQYYFVMFTKRPTRLMRLKPLRPVVSTYATILSTQRTNVQATVQLWLLSMVHRAPFPIRKGMSAMSLSDVTCKSRYCPLRYEQRLLDLCSSLLS